MKDIYYKQDDEIKKLQYCSYCNYYVDKDDYKNHIFKINHFRKYINYFLDYKYSTSKIKYHYYMADFLDDFDKFSDDYINEKFPILEDHSYILYEFPKGTTPYPEIEDELNNLNNYISKLHYKWVCEDLGETGCECGECDECSSTNLLYVYSDSKVLSSKMDMYEYYR